MKISVLDRPLYSYSEASRLLGLPSQTLRRWLDGVTVRGATYPPVIRAEATGVDWVTWGEFVEAGLLRGYRQNNVSLQKIRPFIQRMRESFGVPYPLAHYKPLVLNHKLVYELQQETLLDPALYLVNDEDGQMLLAPPVEDFLSRVEFDLKSGIVSRIYPNRLNTPVVIDPEVAFGVPQIRGIRTESVAESVAAGETYEQAALSWGIGLSDVEAALDWERGLRKAA